MCDTRLEHRTRVELNDTVIAQRKQLTLLMDRLAESTVRRPDRAEPTPCKPDRPETIPLKVGDRARWLTEVQGEIVRLPIPGAFPAYRVREDTSIRDYERAAEDVYPLSDALSLLDDGLIDREVEKRIRAIDAEPTPCQPNRPEAQQNETERFMRLGGSDSPQCGYETLKIDLSMGCQPDRPETRTHEQILDIGNEIIVGAYDQAHSALELCEARKAEGHELTKFEQELYLSLAGIEGSTDRDLTDPEVQP